MDRRRFNPRDRWAVIPKDRVPPKPTLSQHRSTTIYDEDGAIAATAAYIYEDDFDDSPIDTGLLDEFGQMIVRMPWRDRLPLGFHFRPEQYDEYGDFIWESLDE